MPTIDFKDIPGYKRSIGPPDDYELPDTRLWDPNELTNVRFGLRKGADGRFYTRTLQRVRAIELLGKREDIGGGEYDTGWSPEFNYFFPDQRSWDIENVPLADTDVGIQITASGDFGGSAHFDISINGLFVGEAEGRPSSQGGVGEIIDVPGGTWNQVLGEAGNTMTIGFVPFGGDYDHRDELRVRIRYTGASVESHRFVNEEVTFVHHGEGIRKGPDGKFEAFAVYMPDKSEDPIHAYGHLWRAPTDEATGLGVPGRYYFVLPFRTPPSMEAYFNAYPVVCSGPV